MKEMIRKSEKAVRADLRNETMSLHTILRGEDTKEIRKNLERTGQTISEDVFLGIWIMLEARERLIKAP